MTEFDIIKNYFVKEMENRSDVILGIGDDGALVSVPQNQHLAITTDTLVKGVHFPETTHAYDIGYKALAVNLSDLAAMGATPAWVTLALTLPEVDTNWIKQFCEGFFTLANRHGVQLIGGDLTQGPLSITIQAMGLTPNNMSLRRTAAKPGDLIYVTGTLGDAALALAFLQNKIKLDSHVQHYLLNRLNQPEPRLAAGKQLLSIAHAAIDISDGLAADLGHILKASQVGAKLFVDRLPFSNELKQSIPVEQAIHLALTGGDDYELCFTVPQSNKLTLEKHFSTEPCRLTCIGEIINDPSLLLLHEDGTPYHGSIHGYQHF